jgi:predicted RNase H-like nuclease (RuvC/YqgF family)
LYRNYLFFLSQEAITKACIEEQQKNKELLQRLFPEVAVESTNHEEWLSDFISKANSSLHNMKLGSTAFEEHNARTRELELQNDKLQCMIENYKKATCEMDKALETLQDKANEEDQNWQRKIAEKQRELDDLKEVTINKVNLFIVDRF